MPSKKELFELIESMGKTSFTKGEVKEFVHSVSGTRAERYPNIFKKGDMVSNGVGVKKRPCVVVKVCREMLYMIPLSSTKDVLNMCESKSRFMEDGYFSAGMSVVTVEYAQENFIGVYDNNKLLNIAIKKLKESIEGL